MDQVVAVISVICWHQSGLVETGLPWVMALLAMPHCEHLLGSSSGQLGAHGCSSRAGITITLLLSLSKCALDTGGAVCLPEVGTNTLGCRDQILLNSELPFPSFQYLLLSRKGRFLS